MPPTPFRRIDLSSPSNLDYITSVLHNSAESRLPSQLEEDGLKGKQEEAVCRKVLEKWKATTTSKLKDNVTVNGVSWKHATKKGRDDYEQLDAQLQTKVANLSQTIDMLMEDAVTYRRELPLRKAEALRARMEVLEDVRERLQKNRRAVQERGWNQQDASPPPLPFQEIEGGQEQVKWALGNAVAQAEALAQNMPHQIQTVRQQRELVEQLRSMRP